MAEPSEEEVPRVAFRNAVHFTITGVTQEQWDQIVSLVLATEYVLPDESGVWLRKGKDPIFIATIASPRTLEGWQRHKLRAQIQRIIPTALVTVW